MKDRYRSTRGFQAALYGAGLGDAFPLDYVFAGAQVIYQATVRPPESPLRYRQEWDAALGRFKATVASLFRINKTEVVQAVGSIFLNLSVPIDFASIHHVKQWLDGALYSSGLQAVSSMVRFLSNPRRDGTKQPPVNTPGVPPPVTTLPPTAGNVNTQTGPGIFDVQSALNSWGSAIGLDKIAATLGVSSSLILIAVAGLAFIVMAKR
jgi:hypothetical protein